VQDSDLPEGAKPITTEQLLQTIGELYLQSRLQQQTIALQAKLLQEYATAPVPEVRG